MLAVVESSVFNTLFGSDTNTTTKLFACTKDKKVVT